MSPRRKAYLVVRASLTISDWHAPVISRTETN